MHDASNVFADFPSCSNEKVHNLIASCARRIELPAKTQFVTPGDIVDSIYYIYEGRTRHYMVSSDGIEKVVYILNKGWFLRESIFIDGEFVAAERFSVTELPTILYDIDQENYNYLMQFPDFSNELLRSSSIKNTLLRREVESMVFDSGKERLKKLLMAAADPRSIVDEQWHNLKIRYTHQDLASIIGVNRVTISRFTNELCESGFLRIVNKHMQVNRTAFKQE